MSSVTIKISPGDITASKADVCVSSIHRTKDMNRGILASRMKSRAGHTVQNEIYTANGDRELKHGEIVVTAPGKLASNFTKLMFVCLYCWRTGNDETLIASVKECLEKTTNSGFRSIAFPALGMGGQSYPPFCVARGIVTAIVKFIQKNPDTPLTTVYIVLKDRDINSTRTFIQTTIAILDGVKLGQEMGSDNSINLAGVPNFHGLERTKPRNITQEVRRQGGQTSVVASNPTGLAISRQFNFGHMRVEPVMSLTNWSVGVKGEVILDLSGYVPGPVKRFVNFLFGP